MKKLILNPKNLSLKKEEENFFLGKWFLNFLPKSKKKLNFSFLPDRKFVIQDEIKQIRYNKEICEEILKEMVPILNRLNNIEWEYKTWNFLIGTWLYLFINIVFDRINLLKPIIDSQVDYDEQLKSGKDASIASYNVHDFKHKCSLIEWNEKLFLRLLYIMHEKNFDNKLALLNSSIMLTTKKDNFFESIIYEFKIKIIKFFERIICHKNKYLFYNSYILSKLKLFSIILKLGDIPFLYSFSFFDKKVVKAGIDVKLRERININFVNSDTLDKKIIKFLLIEALPTAYLEGFIQQKRLADESYLPKKINKIYTCSAYADNSYKFWLADKINLGKKIIHGQHGAGNNIFKEWFSDTYEVEISEKYFSWGSKKYNPKIISVGNYLINLKEQNKDLSLGKSKKILFVLPLSTIYKGNHQIEYVNTFDENFIEYQKVIDNLDLNVINEFNIRCHPRDIDRELQYSNFINFDKKKINKANFNIPFNDLADSHVPIIFGYLSTEFFKQMSLNKPCLIFMNKTHFDYFLLEDAKQIFIELQKVGILYTDGKSLAKHLNKISDDVGEWWNNERTQNIRGKFCDNYSSPIFNMDLFTKELNL